MAYRFPRLEFLIGPTGAVAPQATKYLMEQHFQQSDFWKDLPFGWVSLLFLSFWLGTVVKELRDPKSWIRHNILEFRKVFDVESVSTTHKWDDADRWGTERVEVWCSIKFLKDLDDPSLTLRVTSWLGSQSATTHLIFNESMGQIKRDQVKRIVLGSLAVTNATPPERRSESIGARHSIWGPVIGTPTLHEGQVTIASGRSMIDLTIASQSYRVFADVLDHSREDSRRIYLVTEDSKVPTI